MKLEVYLTFCHKKRTSCKKKLTLKFEVGLLNIIMLKSSSVIFLKLVGSVVDVSIEGKSMNGQKVSACTL